MNATPKIVAFVMAGGEGTRLRPLTRDLPKPALPIADRCRIIDFALSNLYNSSVRSIFVLLQYRPRALVQHLRKVWGFVSERPGEFVKPVLSGHHFTGTADAVAQSLHLAEGCNPDVVAVFAADHVYRMDVRQMAAFHLAHGGEATVAAFPVPIEQASGFGVLSVDGDWRVTSFAEKPSSPTPMPGAPDRALASMGIYLFRPDAVRRALAAALEQGGCDFGRHVLPRLVDAGALHAYDFSSNRVPGLRTCEDPVYWRDVGTVQAYQAAQDDVHGPRPKLCTTNPAWPIRSGLMVEQPTASDSHADPRQDGSRTEPGRQHMLPSPQDLASLAVDSVQACGFDDHVGAPRTGPGPTCGLLEANGHVAECGVVDHLPSGGPESSAPGMPRLRRRVGPVLWRPRACAKSWTKTRRSA